MPLNQLKPWLSQYPPVWVLVISMAVIHFSCLKPSLVLHRRRRG